MQNHFQDNARQRGQHARANMRQQLPSISVQDAQTRNASPQRHQPHVTNRTQRQAEFQHYPNQAVARPAVTGKPVPAMPAPSQYSRANYGSAQQQNRRKSPWKVVLGVSTVVFVAALIALVVILFSYWQGRDVYSDVAETGFTAPQDISAMQLGDVEVDWEALRAINPDVVAWVYVPGTNINYPVTHRDNNEYYLTHDFKGSEGWLAVFGTIFLEATNRTDFSDDNNVMYGHNMNDGSMFSDIASFTDPQAFNENRTVYLLTPQGNYRLNTFSLVHCEATDPLVQTSFGGAKDFEAYIQDKIDRSVVPVSDIVSAGEMTKTFAFSTCDNLPSDGRYVLFSYVVETTVPGVRVPGAQKAYEGITDSSVENDSEAIEKAIEGTVAE